MDFFNKVGKFFGDVACGVNLHDYQNWDYIEDGDCQQTATCSRCGQENQRVTHIMGGWSYLEDNNCDQICTCERCGREESQTQHKWSGNIRYKSEGNCKQIESCNRCDAVREHNDKHVMEKWVFIRADDCTQVQECQRCGEHGTVQREQHSWGQWQFSETMSKPVRVCGRCGATETRNMDDGLSSAEVLPVDDLENNNTPL